MFDFIAEALRRLSRKTLFKIQEMDCVEMAEGKMSYTVYFYPGITFDVKD